MDTWFPYLAALAPTVGVGFLFYYIMKYILEGDRRERLAQAEWDAQHNAPNESERTFETAPPDSMK